MRFVGEKRSPRKALFYLGFAAALAPPAAAFRMAFTEFESRYQILIFTVLSLAGEWVASRMAGRPFDLPRALFGAFAAAIAIVAMKWRIEGLHPVIDRILELLTGR